MFSTSFLTLYCAFGCAMALYCYECSTPEECKNPKKTKCSDEEKFCESSIMGNESAYKRCRLQRDAICLQDFSDKRPNAKRCYSCNTDYCNLETIDPTLNLFPIG
ncbi:hypothetical protein WA026_000347 [Henosepilachna vigintioctopunctata]|uniref:Uncharacterized protein n=1 Tax=Henosepilachna vigintioctopunctata TaxID=420089 RepID=A0AAW1UXC2_9CUCU